jgi:four helix bundle protein
MNSFEELDCWKLAREIRNEIRLLVRKFPAEEKHRLTDQMIRASRSVTHNIAEGFGRFHYQENIQYCRTSRGSLSELKDQLTVALDEEYIDDSKFKELYEKVDRNINILNGYISYLKRKKDEG